MKRTHIFLGVIGAITGVAAATAAFLTDNVGYAVMSRDTNEIQLVGMVAMAFSITGLSGALVASRLRGIGVGALIFSAAGGLLAISFYYLVPAILFTTAAISVPRPTKSAAATADPARPELRSAVDCPRCKTHFAIPLTRPLSIQCPACGASGRIGAAVSPTPSSRTPGRPS